VDIKTFQGTQDVGTQDAVEPRNLGIGEEDPLPPAADWITAEDTLVLEDDDGTVGKGWE